MGQQAPVAGVVLAVAALMAVGLSDASGADQPAVSCDYSSKTIEAKLKLSHAGEGHLSGVVRKTAFGCQLALSSFKDCRRCASIVNYILGFDRGSCETNPPNAPLGELSERISLHIFRTHAEIGLLAGTPRVVCHTYSFDDDFRRSSVGD